MRKRICAPSMPMRSITRRRPAPDSRKKNRRTSMRNPAQTIRKTGRLFSRAAPARECWSFRSRIRYQKMHRNRKRVCPCSRGHFLFHQPERKRADRQERCLRQPKKTGRGTVTVFAVYRRVWKSMEDNMEIRQEKGKFTLFGYLPMPLCHTPAKNK